MIYGPTRLAAVALLVLLVASTGTAQTPVQVTNDSYLNYMPSLIQRADGSLMIVYERLDGNFENGDLLVTTSADGATWSTPQIVVATAANERHPSLVEMGDGSYRVYYLSDGPGHYTIEEATSPDGVTWTPLGAVDLGWTTEDLVNPTVCCESDGSLTITYDRLSVGGYIAHSANGLVWDHDTTQVSTGSLNRIMRHNDGTYVLSYQRRTGIWYYQIDIFTKTSSDRVAWSAENRVTTNQNSHDSFPVEIAAGEYALYYAKSTGGQPYDLQRRLSPDGASWGSEEGLLPYIGWDTQPHPILLANNGIGLVWARGASQNTTEVYYVAFDPPTSVAASPVGHRPAFLAAEPNPFHRSATIRFSLAPEAQAPVRIVLYDVAGRIVRTLAPAGRESAIQWDGRNSAGRLLPPGVYFARIEGTGQGAGDGACKLLLVR